MVDPSEPEKEYMALVAGPGPDLTKRFLAKARELRVSAEAEGKPVETQWWQAFLDRHGEVE